ncbi:MAG: galactose mutarotase [Lachnospiraceae bacterium]|nr:galactose mutarotase [Lachnospiraceae bacterium]
MVQKERFGVTSDGQAVDRYVIRGAGGAEAAILNLGCIVQELRVPNREGRLQNVVLNYGSVREYYEEDTCYLGACVGRVGNRIGGAVYTWNGETHRLEANEGPNQLHGGPNGFHRQIWEAEAGEDSVTLRRTSPDGEGGFPGNLAVSVTYRMTAENALEITYRARTDRDTPVNLTNHSYFNFTGREDHIFRHQVQLLGSAITEIAAGSIPTGRLLPVEGTPFDFRVPKEVGRDAFAPDPQLALTESYDHNYVLDGSGFRSVASVYLPETGIHMEVFTDQPGVQFYIGNYLAAPHGRNTGLCLETQHYPDSVNHADFPSMMLAPGEEYVTRTAYRFSVR